MASRPLRILMVCMGNICRSPMAEGIFRACAAEAGLPVEVDSAGTSSFHVGDAPDKRARHEMAKRGIDINALRGRQLKQADLDYFDHVLVMDHSNLRNALALCITDDQRAKVQLILPDGQEVPDPYFGGDEGFTQVYEMLNEACNRHVNSWLYQNNARQV